MRVVLFLAGVAVGLFYREEIFRGYGSVSYSLFQFLNGRIKEPKQ